MSDFFADKTVLLPFDFSDAASGAVDEVINLSEDSTRLHLVTVLSPLYAIPVEPGMMMDVGDDGERIEKALDGMKERFGTVDNVTFEARVGDPGLEIVDYASEIGAKLIVMPSHGRTGLKRLFLGSVAERVVRMANCTVMILRKP